ncbi:hypothetical protein SHIRM173S_13125 [Streptomyces hirsutus]
MSCPRTPARSSHHRHRRGGRALRPRPVDPDGGRHRGSGATPTPWWAPRKRSPRRCSTTTTWASTSCPPAATPCSTTRSTSAGPLILLVREEVAKRNADRAAGQAVGQASRQPPRPRTDGRPPTCEPSHAQNPPAPRCHRPRAAARTGADRLWIRRAPPVPERCPQVSAAPSDDPVAAVRTVESVDALLPAGVRASGTLRVGSSIGFPPRRMTSDGSDEPPAGQDIDVADAVAKVLGVELQPAGRFVRDDSARPRQRQVRRRHRQLRRDRRASRRPSTSSPTSTTARASPWPRATGPSGSGSPTSSSCAG